MIKNHIKSLVKTSLRGEVQLIGINRPEKKNCVNHQTALQLIDAFEKFEADDKAKIAILYGEGGSFCSGYDLSVVSSGEFSVDQDFLKKYRVMGPTAMRLKKPLIAAIEGYAVAGGLELALMADLRVCTTSTQFGVFCRRSGVPLIDGGTVRLPRIIGLGRAMDMILTGRSVGAKEALSWGLANRVVDDGTALDYSIKLAETILQYPYECMRADRESTYNSYDVGFQEAMEKEIQSVAVLPKAIAGAAKFVNKEMAPPSKL